MHLAGPSRRQGCIEVLQGLVRVVHPQLRNPTILCSPGGQFSPDGVVFAGEPTVDDRRPIMCITEVLTKWDMDKVDPEFKAKQDYLAFYMALIRCVIHFIRGERLPVTKALDIHYTHSSRLLQAAIFRH